MLNKEQTNFLLVNAYNAAIRAGARIIDIYTGDADFAVDIKSDHTPITIADRDAHELIKKYLSQTRVPLLSEEGRDLLYEERRNWDLFWMVDPLDGTKEFLKGNGEFTVNIALMHNNEPYIGVIYVPYIHKIYFALKGAGCYLKTDVEPDHEALFDLPQIWSDTTRLPLCDKANEPIRIAVSRSHNTDETFEHIARIKAVHPAAEIVEQGSSFKFCLLAEGTVEIYVRTSNTYEWDTAAGGDHSQRSGRGRRTVRRGRGIAIQQDLAAQSAFRMPQQIFQVIFRNFRPGTFRFGRTFSTFAP